MEKELLEIGDKIKRFEVSAGEIGNTYEVESVTKTLAKTKDDSTFYRNLNYNTTKPMDNYIAEVKRKDLGTTSIGKRFFLIK